MDNEKDFQNDNPPSQEVKKRITIVADKANGTTVISEAISEFANFANEEARLDVPVTSPVDLANARDAASQEHEYRGLVWPNSRAIPATVKPQVSAATGLDDKTNMDRLLTDGQISAYTQHRWMDTVDEATASGVVQIRQHVALDVTPRLDGFEALTLERKTDGDAKTAVNTKKRYLIKGFRPYAKEGEQFFDVVEIDATAYPGVHGDANVLMSKTAIKDASAVAAYADAITGARYQFDRHPNASTVGMEEFVTDFSSLGTRAGDSYTNDERKLALRWTPLQVVNTAQSFAESELLMLLPYLNCSGWREESFTAKALEGATGYAADHVNYGLRGVPYSSSATDAPSGLTIGDFFKTWDHSADKKFAKAHQLLMIGTATAPKSIMDGLIKGYANYLADTDAGFIHNKLADSLADALREGMLTKAVGDSMVWRRGSEVYFTVAFNPNDFVVHDDVEVVTDYYAPKIKYFYDVVGQSIQTSGTARFSIAMAPVWMRNLVTAARSTRYKTMVTGASASRAAAGTVYPMSIRPGYPSAFDAVMLNIGDTLAKDYNRKQLDASTMSVRFNHFVKAYSDHEWGKKHPTQDEHVSVAQLADRLGKTDADVIPKIRMKASDIPSLPASIVRQVNRDLSRFTPFAMVGKKAKTYVSTATLYDFTGIAPSWNTSNATVSGVVIGAPTNVNVNQLYVGDWLVTDSSNGAKTFVNAPDMLAWMLQNADGVVRVPGTDYLVPYKGDFLYSASFQPSSSAYAGIAGAVTDESVDDYLLSKYSGFDHLIVLRAEISPVAGVTCTLKDGTNVRLDTLKWFVAPFVPAVSGVHTADTGLVNTKAYSMARRGLARGFIRCQDFTGHYNPQRTYKDSEANELPAANVSVAAFVDRSVSDIGEETYLARLGYAPSVTANKVTVSSAHIPVVMKQTRLSESCNDTSLLWRRRRFVTMGSGLYDVFIEEDYSKVVKTIDQIGRLAHLLPLAWGYGSYVDSAMALTSPKNYYSFWLNKLGTGRCAVIRKNTDAHKIAAAEYFGDARVAYSFSPLSMFTHLDAFGLDNEDLEVVTLCSDAVDDVLSAARADGSLFYGYGTSRLFDMEEEATMSFGDRFF